MRVDRRHLFQRLAGQTPSEWGLLVRAQLALLAAQTIVWTRTTGALVDSADATDAVILVRRPPNPAAYRLAVAVRRAAAYGVFRPRCLVRSLALSRLLTHDGIAGGRIRIGVRVEGGQFLAHAWVELDGRVLGDAPQRTAAFTPLADLHAARSPRSGTEAVRR